MDLFPGESDLLDMVFSMDMDTFPAAPATMQMDDSWLLSPHAAPATATAFDFAPAPHAGAFSLSGPAFPETPACSMAALVAGDAGASAEGIMNNGPLLAPAPAGPYFTPSPAMDVVPSPSPPPAEAQARTCAMSTTSTSPEPGRPRRARAAQVTPEVVEMPGRPRRARAARVKSEMAMVEMDDMDEVKPEVTRKRKRPANKKRGCGLVATPLTEEEVADLVSKGLDPSLAKEELTEAEIRKLKRQRRLIKNRESAHNSRQRKKAEMNGLAAQLKATSSRNAELERRVVTLENEKTKLGQANAHLRAELDQLRAELDTATQKFGVSMDHIENGTGIYNRLSGSGPRVSSLPRAAATTTAVFMVMVFSFGLLLDGSPAGSVLGGPAVPTALERETIPEVVPSATSARSYRPAARVLTSIAPSDVTAAASAKDADAVYEYNTHTSQRPAGLPTRVFHRESLASNVAQDLRARLTTPSKLDSAATVVAAAATAVAADLPLMDSIWRDLQSHPQALEAVRSLQRSSRSTNTPDPMDVVGERRHTSGLAKTSTLKTDAYILAPSAQAFLSPMDSMDGSSKSSADFPIVSFVVPSSEQYTNASTGLVEERTHMLQLTCQLLDIGIVSDN